MANIFDSIAFRKPKSSRFSLKHKVLTSFSMGELVPTCVMEAIPGDTFTIRPVTFLRTMPLVAPIMGRVDVRTDFFFVPARLVWEEFPDFITGVEGIEAPYVASDEWSPNTLADYLGIPPSSLGTPIPVSPIPAASYLLIWDTYYRNQNLQTTEQFVPLVNGNNNNYVAKLGASLRRVNWRRDYLTACLPDAQANDAVQIPLTNQPNIPVEYEYGGGPANQEVGLFRNANDGTVFTPTGPVTNDTGPTPLAASMHVGGTPVAYDPNGTLNVDIQSDAVPITTLRRAFALQRWLEKTIQGGKRYAEHIRTMFGVKPQDARLQRPEFIGSFSQPMTISEVLATAESTGVPVGNMAGHAISAGGGMAYRYTCQEHGFIIGVVSVRPEAMYQQGLLRHFTRFSPFDYLWPDFQDIGEQEVLNKEVYIESSDPDGIFGYQMRFAEYKFHPNMVTAEMRDSLDTWHLGRKFTSAPALNESFIVCDPTTRIFAVTDPEEDQIVAEIVNDVMVNRKLKRYATT